MTGVQTCALPILRVRALALQFTTAQARFQAGDGPALAELLDVCLQALQRQASLIGGADECVVEDELRAPAVALGPGLQLAAQGRGGRGGPERGEVQGLGVQVGAHQRLVGPGQDAGGERERGFRAGGAGRALGVGAQVQRGLCAGERAACPGFGGQAQAGTVGHGGADVALQVQRQRHRGFAAQAELCAVVAVGELQRVQAQAVGGAQARGVGQRGGVPAVAQGAVTVVILPANIRQASPQPSEAQLDAVCRYLDQRRLITTELYVTGPRYLAISMLALEVRAAHNTDLASVSDAVYQQLLDYFHPLRGGESGQGWPFGEDLYLGNLYQRLLAISGVKRVQNLQLQLAEQQLSCQDVLSVPDGHLLQLNREHIALKVSYE